MYDAVTTVMIYFVGLTYSDNSVLYQVNTHVVIPTQIPHPKAMQVAQDDTLRKIWYEFLLAINYLFMFSFLTVLSFLPISAVLHSSNPPPAVPLPFLLFSIPTVFHPSLFLLFFTLL